MTRTLLLAFALSTLAVSARAGDREDLVGTWRIKVFQDDGRDRLERLGVGKPRNGEPRVAKLVFTPDACHVLRGDGRREARAGLANAAWKSVTLDPSTTPKSIDITGFAGNASEETKSYVGIYALEGRTLRICWNEQGGQRPTKLESDGTNNLFVCDKIADEPLPIPGESRE